MRTFNFSMNFKSLTGRFSLLINIGKFITQPQFYTILANLVMYNTTKIPNYRLSNNFLNYQKRRPHCAVLILNGFQTLQACWYSDLLLINFDVY